MTVKNMWATLDTYMVHLWLYKDVNQQRYWLFNHRPNLIGCHCLQESDRADRCLCDRGRSAAGQHIAGNVGWWTHVAGGNACKWSDTKCMPGERDWQVDDHDDDDDGDGDDDDDDGDDDDDDDERCLDYVSIRNKITTLEKTSV